MTRSLSARWIAPTVLVAIALALYLTTLSHVHTFDALSYIRDVDGRTGFFFHPHHLLYSPTGWLFWQGWRLLGYTGNSELPLKVLNSVATAGCAFVLYRLVLRLTRQPAAAAVAAGLLLFNYASWYFSAEVEVYMLALVWLVATLWLLVELVRAPRSRTAPLLGLVLGLAGLYHQTNGLLVPVVVVGFALAPSTLQKKLRDLIVCGVVAGGTVALGYGLIGFGLSGYRSLGELRDWMFFYVQTGWWGQATTRGRESDLAVGLGDFISTRSPLPFWIGIGALLLLGLPAVRRWPRIAAVCAAWILIYGAFFTWWEAENIEFWIGTLLPLWLLVGLAIASVRPRWLARTAMVVALVGVEALAVHNYPIVKLRGDAAYDLQRQLSSGVREVTSRDDLILSPGGVMELYLPYYEDRPNVRTLNGVLFETNGNVDEALGRIAGYISQSLHAGLGVVVGREVMRIPPEIFQRYDIPQDKLDAFWSPYREAMRPAVANKGETYFWRIPPAQEVAAKGGWRWSSFDWGWQPANIGEVSFGDGWCFNPQSDPSLLGPSINLDTTSVRAAEITMSTAAKNQTAQLFYAGPDGKLSDARSRQWKVKGDGEFHTYAVELAGTEGWQGGIARLRLDPIAVGDGSAESRTCVRELRLVR